MCRWCKLTLLVNSDVWHECSIRSAKVFFPFSPLPSLFSSAPVVFLAWKPLGLNEIGLLDSSPVQCHGRLGRGFAVLLYFTLRENSRSIITLGGFNGTAATHCTVSARSHLPEQVNCIDLLEFPAHSFLFFLTYTVVDFLCPHISIIARFYRRFDTDSVQASKTIPNEAR